MIPLKIAILGTGNIARTMAATINLMPQAEVYAVGSRTLEKAKRFAAEFGVPKYYGSYEEMAQDEGVKLAYIATPHSEHYEHAKLCLNHGKHVLCEKAFAVNAIQAEEMVSLARDKGLLLAEAMWVRYMPMAKTLQEVLASGAIGRPMTLTANLCYLIDQVPRLLDPRLAGGALLDVGVYALNFAFMAFGEAITRMDSTAIMTDTGVDAQNSITLCYQDGKMAILNSSIRVLSDRKGVIYGTDGYMVVENINNLESIKCYDRNRALVETHQRPEQISGYEYQILACQEAIQNGWTQCPQMPHQAILAAMKVMDGLRKQWGLAYPME